MTNKLFIQIQSLNWINYSPIDKNESLADRRSLIRNNLENIINKRTNSKGKVPTK